MGYYFRLSLDKSYIFINKVTIHNNEKFLTVFFHEWTHLFQDSHGQEIDMYDYEKHGYWNCPYEIEARQMADFLLDQFNRFSNNWKTDDIYFDN